MDAQAILRKLKKDQVSYISLQFTDLMGIIKEVVVPVEGIAGVFKNGLWFDGSSVDGFARIQESDLFLRPDLETYSLVPWHNDSGITARFICDIFNSSGQPFEGDPRNVLKKLMAEAAKLGLYYNVGPEPEFYMFKKDENFLEPMDKNGYFDVSSAEGYSVIKETIDALKHFNIEVETSHHEVGDGQYEIDFRYGDALQVADSLLALKYTTKRVAQMHGFLLTFMPKPIRGAAGSGMHVHQSLSDKAGKNLFFSDKDMYQLSQTARYFIAGQMKHIKAMVAVLCPTVNSYKRLVSGFEAPVYISWASANRSALIRVPRWSKNKPQSARIELRCPDPTCNPYLAFSVMLKAGIDGIKNKLEVPNPVEENVYELDDKKLAQKKIDCLPNSLLEALGEFKKSTLFREALGEDLFEKYLSIKTREWDEFKTEISAWEKEKYLNLY
jgi:glutamine synthetase